MIWSHLNHPNILPFYGINDKLFVVGVPVLISPLLSRGNVVEYLETQEVSHDLLWKLVRTTKLDAFYTIDLP